jgi:CheY-like chemotaxis protein
MEQSSEEVRVLLVEDDAALAQMYRVKLERDGYVVRMAGDGEEALELIADELPDLIFLDIRLPKMDGMTLLERLRAAPRTRNIPVVIVSNYSEEELVSRGLQLGALEYLVKSQTTPGQLSQGVREWTRPYEYPGEPANHKSASAPDGDGL